MNLLPILILHIMWHTIYWYPWRTLPSLISSTMWEPFWKEILTIVLSFWMARSPKLVPLALSISKAFLSVLGILIPNMWVFCQYHILNSEMIQSLQLGTFLTQHLNTGSSCNRLSTAYVESSMVLKCWESTKSTYSEDLTFHSTCKVQLLVVFFVCTLPDFLIRNLFAWLIVNASLQ